MRAKSTGKAIWKSILVIGVISIFQPYMVLFLRYGPSNECWNCLIIEQTFWTSILYLFLPLTSIYLVTKKLRLNSIIQGCVLAAFYVPVSFVKITIPLFDDRIASWSTFSEEEIWYSALFAATPYMGLLSFFIILSLHQLNKKPSKIKNSELLDDL
jgi:hypothetical protein